MKEIPLTQGKVALVDDEDYERLLEFKWKYINSHNRSDARCGNTPMSHIVLQTSEMVDHKDNNALNNQKANLRICTYSQNNRNRGKTRSRTHSKYKGVALRNRTKKWGAHIELQDIFGQRIHKRLGSFSLEEEAAMAYDNAARQYFGEFAALNFPVEGERSCLEG